MDPLSQGLLGAGLAGAISKSKNLKKALFCGFVSGLSPDIIIVTAPCISESEITRVSIGLYLLSLVSKARYVLSEAVLKSTNK